MLKRPTYKATARGIVVDADTETPIATTNPTDTEKTNMKQPTAAISKTAQKGPPPDEVKIEARPGEHEQTLISITLPNGEVKIISKTA